VTDLKDVVMAARISGVSPADIAALMIFCSRGVG
jgi:tRNA U34 5-carboxymethylaminomethyl modifying enzyme MnmG/GidA